LTALLLKTKFINSDGQEFLQITILKRDHDIRLA